MSMSTSICSVIPAKAGIQYSRHRPIHRQNWTPAFAGVTVLLSAFAAIAETPTQLDEIVVTATHDTLADRREAVTQKTVLDKQEIEALGGLTVGEVIRKLPGIDAGEHSGDGAPSAKTRGMGRDAVQFLVERLQHDAKRPATEDFEDFVMPETPQRFGLCARFKKSQLLSLSSGRDLPGRDRFRQ